MAARWVRILASGALLTGMVVRPAAAAECALTGPQSVPVGTPLSVDGTGFAASNTIDVSVALDGASVDTIRLTSDASGAFQIGWTPEQADAGRTTIIASDGACTAEVVVLVLLAGQTTPPDSPSEPDTGPVGDAAAGETGPPTDARRVQTGTGPTVTGPWSMAAALLAIGVAGRLATRRTTPR